MGRQLDNWLDSYMEYTRNTEPTELFRMWTGISVIASALQRKVVFEMGSLKFFPNMYIILVGSSGVTRKGVAMSSGIPFIRDLGVPLAAERITLEALSRFMKNNTNSIITEENTTQIHTSMTLVAPELVVLLGHKNNQDFLSALTDWFDCPVDWEYRTKQSGTDTLKNVWVNLFGATTPALIQSHLPQEAIGGGFTSRVVFVYAQRKAKAIPFPIWTDKEKLLQQKLLIDLGEIHQMQGNYQMTEDAIDSYAQWYVENDAHPPINDPRFDGYTSRRGAHLLKLSMILSASYTEKLVITKKILQKAVDILEQTEIQMPNVFAGYGKAANINILQNVMTDVLRKGSIPFHALLNKYRHDVDHGEMKKILYTLFQMRYATHETVLEDGKRTWYIKYLGEHKKQQ